MNVLSVVLCVRQMDLSTSRLRHRRQLVADSDLEQWIAPIERTNYTVYGIRPHLIR